MYTEGRIGAAMQAMLRGIEPPPVPMEAIRQRIAHPPRTAHGSWRLWFAAAAAILVVAFPSVAPGVTQSIEAEIRAILHWTPPPPPPAWVSSAMRSQIGTLAAAQARVSFAIVPPAGLPRDAVSERIATTPASVYSKVTHRWSIGGPAVTFIYRRADGRTFMLWADRVDPREGPPPQHIFVDRGERNGHEFLQRHDNFAWRNGEQVMSAVAGEGLSAPEIVAIRSAMHGIPFYGVWPPHPVTVVKQYRIP